MITDKDTQIRILTLIIKKLLKKLDIDPTEYLKSEFKTALIDKYNFFKYPKMSVTIKHQ